MSRSAASIRHDIDYMDEDHCFHSSVSNGIRRTEWFISAGYSAMTKARYMTNGYINRKTAATVDCERGICN
ncbi:hypothetical protein AHAS_Ahas06G0161200 [Arachis hypogaea]